MGVWKLQNDCQIFDSVSAKKSQLIWLPMGFHGKCFFLLLWYHSFFCSIMVLIYWHYFIGFGRLKSFLIWDNKWTTRKEFPIQESWDGCRPKLIKMQNFLISSTPEGCSKYNYNYFFLLINVFFLNDLIIILIYVMIYVILYIRC